MFLGHFFCCNPPKKIFLGGLQQKEVFGHVPNHSWPLEVDRKKNNKNNTFNNVINVIDNVITPTVCLIFTFLRISQGHASR